MNTLSTYHYIYIKKKSYDIECKLQFKSIPGFMDAYTDMVNKNFNSMRFETTLSDEKGVWENCKCFCVWKLVHRCVTDCVKLLPSVSNRFELLC